MIARECGVWCGGGGGAMLWRHYSRGAAAGSKREDGRRGQTRTDAARRIAANRLSAHLPVPACAVRTCASSVLPPPALFAYARHVAHSVGGRE